MFSKAKTIARTTLTAILSSAALFAQQAPPAPKPAASIEFPVIMLDRINAGKTPVGTKIQAKLVVATMVDGVVVPRDAIFSGEVTESAAKSATDPSRLAISMNSVQWKNGTATVKVYLTSWFYPVAAMAPQDLSYGAPDAPNSPKHWNGAGPYPDPKDPITQPKFPGRDSDKDTGLPSSSPASAISKHRVLMKNVESTRNSDGALTLSSKGSNIKLDKTTTYVFAAGELLPKN